MAGKRKIADQVEHLVANELIRKAQAPVLHAVAGQDDSVFFRGAADQSHVAQHELVFAEAEGARRRDLRSVRISSQVDRVFLPSDRRGKVDLVGDAVTIARIDADKLAVLAHFHFAQDAQIFAAAALNLDAYPLEGFDIRDRAAVQNRQL